MRYWPSVFSVVARSRPLLSSRAVTAALVTTPPLGSLTVTCRSPVATPWAKPEGGEQNQLNRDCDELPQHHKSFLRRRGRGLTGR